MSTKRERLAVVFYPHVTTELPLPLMAAGRSRATRMSPQKLVVGGNVPTQAERSTIGALLDAAAENLIAGATRQQRAGVQGIT